MPTHSVRQRVADYLTEHVNVPICDSCLQTAVSSPTLSQVNVSARYWAGRARGPMFGFKRGLSTCAACGKPGLVTKRLKGGPSKR